MPKGPLNYQQAKPIRFSDAQTEFIEQWCQEQKNGMSFAHAVRLAVDQFIAQEKAAKIKKRRERVKRAKVAEEN